MCFNLDEGCLASSDTLFYANSRAKITLFRAGRMSGIDLRNDEAPSLVSYIQDEGCDLKYLQGKHRVLRVKL